MWVSSFLLLLRYLIHHTIPSVQYCLNPPLSVFTDSP
jgi:hypothetical protein